MEERPKLTREQAIEYCEREQYAHQTAADHIDKVSNTHVEGLARKKRNRHVAQAYIFGDIAELLKEGVRA